MDENDGLLESGRFHYSFVDGNYKRYKGGILREQGAIFSKSGVQLKNGIWKQYFPNGEVKEEKEYFLDKPVKVYSEFSMAKCNYINSKRKLYRYLASLGIDYHI